MFFLSFFQYDCLDAPLNVGNRKYAWWTDRKNDKQYYWTGDGSNLREGCQCGLDVRNSNILNRFFSPTNFTIFKYNTPFLISSKSFEEMIHI